MLRLSTFAISHFSEKARWALDLNRVKYTERVLVPGPHILAVRRRSPTSTVPTLEHDRTVVQGSSAILDYLEQHLGATQLAAHSAVAERSVALEELADRAFGVGIQRIFYATLLKHREVVIDMWTQRSPAWSRVFFALAYGVVSHAVRRMYTIRADAVEEAKVLFRSAMDETDRALADGPYLMGDTLSRVDVTVASLLAPMCCPPEHSLRWPTGFPPELASFVGELEGRPTWDFVLRMYRDHRAPS